MVAAVQVPIVALSSFTTLTIDSGAVTATQSLHIITPEAGATDDLDSIVPAALDDGYLNLMIIRAAAGKTIVLVNAAGTNTFLWSSGGDLSIADGAGLLIYHDGTNWRDSQAGIDRVMGATVVVGVEDPDDINVTIQLTNLMGGDLASRASVQFYLADDANGDTPSAAAPDGGIVIGTDGAMIEWTANLSGLLISEADGDIDITLTDSGTPTFYLILIMPDGSLVASDAITFA